MKPITLAFVIALFLTACGTDTPLPTPTATPAPTQSPELTPHPRILADTRRLPHPGGTWGYSVTENGQTYVYTPMELGVTKDGEVIKENVREVADFFLFDWPTFEGAARYQLLITDNALGERSLYKMTHKDFTMEDVPNPNNFDPSPITSLFSFHLEKAIGITGSTFLEKIKGPGIEKEIVVPDGTPEGKAETVNLSTTTGFIVTIVDPITMRELGGDNISTFQLGDITVLAQVYGVDGAKNELCRLAFEGNLNEIDDYILRQAMFVFPARLIENNNQGNIGQSQLSIDLARNSQRPRTEGSETLDLEIERVSTPTEAGTQTPTPTPSP
ncbi:MAG: hypothetical protein HND47_18860 [Chloroflexi bacterium]|nr:hypothetical protein [Chloroflexota bacterium]